jgi:hypothetical protein
VNLPQERGGCGRILKKNPFIFPAVKKVLALIQGKDRMVFSAIV